MKDTTIFRFRSLSHLHPNTHQITQTKQHNSNRNIGSNAVRNILKMAVVGANKFISLSSKNQSNDIKDSEELPTLST
jgi:hypothetical protein